MRDAGCNRLQTAGHEDTKALRELVNLPWIFGHQEKTLYCVRRCPHVRPNTA